jgi:type I restriction-modification system DNA methylase subunit
MLNEVVQRILDRFVFIRIAEDRKIVEPKSLLELVELWKREGKRRPLQYHLNILFRQINADLNGEIFKSHACEIYEFDSSLLAMIIEGLYFPKCPYRFDVIGVELLGSIYERYLGNTIRLTAKRVKVEEKLEVRKAGGVYYTPKYIVDYIVNNTVGKLMEGKTPEEIAEIKILDPACGSGSFLLGAYQKLIDYHIKYYTEHPAEAGRSTLFPDLIIDPDGSHRLSITKKAEILQNNIFGVDIDPQAVEVSMMSLYIKALEGERTLPQNKELLPSLANNIKCGNSLIGYDFFEQQTLIEDEERNRINPFDWNSRKAGFGDIMEKGGFDCVIGNPPYGAFFEKSDKTYLLKQYKNCPSSLDSYLLFYERCLGHLLKTDGILGFITPNTWELIFSTAQFRAFVLTNFSINEIVHYTHKVFKSATVDCEIVIIENAKRQKHNAFVTVQSESKSLQHEIPQSFWLSPNGDPFNILLTEKEHALLAKISSKSVHVDDIFLIKNGVKPFEGGKGKTPQTREIVETKPYVSETKQDDTFRPLLRGSLIQRYINFWNEDYWISYGPWLAAPRDPKIFEAPEKIVCRQTGDRIICTLIDNKFICRDNLHIILPQNCNYNLKYILGILNSSFCDFCYRAINPEKGEALAQIKKKHLGQLLIRTIDFSNPSEKEAHDKLVALVDRMLELNSKKNALPPSSERERIEREIAVTDEKIEEIVYGLYGLTEEEIRVVEEHA